MYFPLSLERTGVTTTRYDLWFFLPLGVSLIFSIVDIIATRGLFSQLVVPPPVCFFLSLEQFVCRLLQLTR